MQTTFTRGTKRAFVLKDSQIEAIATIMADAGHTIHIEAQCADHRAKRKFLDVPELLAYENGKDKKIVSMFISSASSSGSAIVSWRLLGGWSGHTVVEVQDDQEDVVRIILGKLNDVIGGTKPWYSWIAWIDHLSIASVLLVFPVSYIFFRAYQITQEIMSGVAASSVTPAPFILQIALGIGILMAYMLLVIPVVLVRTQSVSGSFILDRTGNPAKQDNGMGAKVDSRITGFCGIRWSSSDILRMRTGGARKQ